MNALKYAYMSVKTGNSDNAVSTGSEKLSTWMSAQTFEEEAQKLKEFIYLKEGLEHYFQIK